MDSNKYPNKQIVYKIDTAIKLVEITRDSTAVKIFIIYFVLRISILDGVFRRRWM